MPGRDIWCALFFCDLRDIREYVHKSFGILAHSSKQFPTLFDIIHGGYLVYLKIYLYAKKIKMMGDKNMAFNMYGGQFNYAKDNAMINATQNNGVSANELDEIVKGIMANLSGLDEDDADRIRDIVDMAKDELEKPEPKVSMLKNCLALIAPMITVANGVPVLMDNLQKLLDYIAPFIK